MFASAVIAALAIAPSALASVFITAPVSTTTWTAGQQQTIVWQDSGVYPSLSQMGLASAGIYVGNALVQTQVQQIVASVNVSSTGSIVFTPDATMGPNSNEYFIRFQSLSLMQNGTTYPVEAFSAKFTLSGMSGQFDAAESSEISGQSTAPIGGAATSASSASVTPTSSAGASISSSASSSSHSASATTTGKNGAAALSISHISGAAGVAVAVLAAMLL